MVKSTGGQSSGLGSTSPRPEMSERLVRSSPKRPEPPENTSPVPSFALEFECGVSLREGDLKGG